MSINIKTHGYSVTRNTTAGRAPIRYIVMHYTATHGATAYNEVMYFAKNPAAVNSSADFFIDDADIYQYNTMIDTRYSWAVGDGSSGTYGGVCGNPNQISVEMSCRQSGGKWYISDATYKNAVLLVSYLMEKYGVPAERVIRHYDVSRKLCPNAYGWLAATGSEAVWQRFKREIVSKNAEGTDIIYRVRLSADNAKSQIGAFRNLASAKALAEKRGYSVFDTSGKLVYASGKSGAKKSNEEIAREVIAGKWGNGSERKLLLTNAGYNYSAIQTIVNRMF